MSGPAADSQVSGRAGPRAGILDGMLSSFLDQPGPLAFAHRGGAAHGPENSWAAFERAVDLGFRYLETDVQATSDGMLIAFHDRTLDRVTDRTGRIARMPYRVVAAARIGGKEPIPLLEDLLGAWPEARFNIDMKDESAIAPLVRVLRRTAAWDRVCVTSFSSRRLHAFRQSVDRQVCTTLSPLGLAAIHSGALACGMSTRLARAGVRCAQIPARLATPAFLGRLRRSGLQIHVWTVNEPALMRRLLDLAVDGIMTDDTVALRDVLTERAQWHGTGTGTGGRGAGGTG
ncbi:MAG TPA: glycerophosphodiester phosphodiesterase [Streptosporangiaceae bacterium]|nr:glycerophosphodiester phosphodiesterase [Streptosporangiaceae bacterium]